MTLKWGGGPKLSHTPTSERAWRADLRAALDGIYGPEWKRRAEHLVWTDPQPERVDARWRELRTPPPTPPPLLRTASTWVWIAAFSVFGLAAMFAVLVVSNPVRWFLAVLWLPYPFLGWLFAAQERRKRERR